MFDLLAPAAASPEGFSLADGEMDAASKLDCTGEPIWLASPGKKILAEPSKFARQSKLFFCHQIAGLAKRSYTVLGKRAKAICLAGTNNGVLYSHPLTCRERSPPSLSVRMTRVGSSVSPCLLQIYMITYTRKQRILYDFRSYNI